MSNCKFCGACRWLGDGSCSNCGAFKLEADRVADYKGPVGNITPERAALANTAVTLRNLRRGDYVVFGLYAGDWNKGTRIVERVELAQATGYRVVTFSDKAQTSGHKDTFVHIKR